jgi:hypothetical protein
MAIEIRQMHINSRVLQDEQGGAVAPMAPSTPRPAPSGRAWEAECRRLIQQVLDERKER